MRVGKYDIRRGDPLNIVISEVVAKKATGEEYLSNSKYYSTWESALVRALELHIVSPDVKTILKEIKSAKEEIIKAVKSAKL